MNKNAIFAPVAILWALQFIAFQSLKFRIGKWFLIPIRTYRLQSSSSRNRIENEILKSAELQILWTPANSESFMLTRRVAYRNTFKPAASVELHDAPGGAWLDVRVGTVLYFIPLAFLSLCFFGPVGLAFGAGSFILWIGVSVGVFRYEDKNLRGVLEEILARASTRR